MESKTDEIGGMTGRQLALQLFNIILDTIKEAGPQGIPSGHLYAMLCGHIGLGTYQVIIDAMVATKLIKCNGWLLTYNQKEDQNGREKEQRGSDQGVLLQGQQEG